MVNYSTSMTFNQKNILCGSAIAVMFILSGWNPLLSPWWDEGWTLSVARNWAELGHYGLLLNGERVPPTLAAHSPVIAPITLSFKLFGVGVIQARMVIVLFTITTLLLLFIITQRLYDRATAFATLAILLLFPAQWQIHPFIIGRQVLGEMPSLFYLLAGYTCFLFTEKRPAIWGTFAAMFWGVALMTKLQVMPFWIVSMFLPITLALLTRRWRIAGFVVLILVGSLGVYQLLVLVKGTFIDNPSLPKFDVTGLTEVSALVFVLKTRLRALRFLVVFGIPTLLGFLYVTRRMVMNYRRADGATTREVVSQMLIGMVGSWCAWHILLSVGWARYAFPPMFIGALFIAALLNRLTGGFNLKATYGFALKAIRTRTWRGDGFYALLAIFVVAAMSVPAVRSLYLFSLVQSDASLTETTHFLNTTVQPDDTIETYESELFFLLDRRYHFPPPRVNVEIIKKSWIDPKTTIVYDPLTENPKYLVVGGWGKLTQLYEPVLQTGAFRLVHSIGDYDIYERKRN